MQIHFTRTGTQQRADHLPPPDESGGSGVVHVDAIRVRRQNKGEGEEEDPNATQRGFLVVVSK